MPSRGFQERLQDILTEIEEIQQMVTELSFEEFCQDQRTIKATLYSLAVIGEAAASLLPEATALSADSLASDERNAKYHRT
ncbi:HepT-like ribonuclease domain-containing protein [Egbenema bharatensis]|uniref:HepT-like ribonuclease domain-containing protein n=1 Tax=Egbenema bharatensis TaxID=3463334 RepID=UPI003A88FA63